MLLRFGNQLCSDDLVAAVVASHSIPRTAALEGEDYDLNNGVATPIVAPGVNQEGEGEWEEEEEIRVDMDVDNNVEIPQLEYGGRSMIHIKLRWILRGLI